jgi:hypothetical protein
VDLSNGAMPEKAAKNKCPAGETLDMWFTIIAIGQVEDGKVTLHWKLVGLTQTFKDFSG